MIKKKLIKNARKIDQFVTAGLGYSSANLKNDSQFVISAFTTENTFGDLNSTLLSFDFKKKF